MKKNVCDLQKEFLETDLNAYVTTEQVAAHLHVSRSWFDNRAVSGGGIPFIKPAGKRLYKKSDVLKWIEQRSKLVRSTSEY